MGLGLQFDVFHSLSRIDSLTPRLSDRDVMRQFFEQLQLAEDCGFRTMWLAESHFSSEVQKHNKQPVIPNYRGEVGINADSMQLIQQAMARTGKIGFGTAIHNIVGGNGGPIASADRVRSLVFLNGFLPTPRRLDIGFAAGRFPYINAPFGILPRDKIETTCWPQVQRLIFLEATEIFLRLSQGETLASDDLKRWTINSGMFRSPGDWEQAVQAAGLSKDVDAIPYRQRWTFEKLRLVPEVSEQMSALLHFILGSHDPMAREVATKHADVDLFNLSFTAPDAIDAAHREMEQICATYQRRWHRGRMPRTVLVFIDKDRRVAEKMASMCLDTYIEAMRGTAVLPPKTELLSRALVGDPETIREQLSPTNARRFAADDRLMLWFEFNQVDHAAIASQMSMFARDVMPYYSPKVLQ